MIPLVKKLAYKVVVGFLRRQTVRLLKANSQLKIVAVTGSVGKTTTKRAIAAVLQQKYKVIYHPGNYNTETGLPLSLFEQESPGRILNLRWFKIWFRNERKLRQPYPYEVAVLEMGADQEGEIGYFMSFMRPDIGVVTAMKPAHMEGFKNMETIVREKFKLAQGSKSVLLNADDQRVMSQKDKLNGAQTYGLEAGDFQCNPLSSDLKQGWLGRFVLPKATFEATVRLFGKHNLGAAAAAVGVGHLMSLNQKQLLAGIGMIGPVSGRMNLLPGVNGSLIIDDSYNSNPEAVTPALDTLYQMDGRKIAILGQMNEMGEYSEQYHREVGHHCAKLDLLVTVGEDAEKYLAEEAVRAGLKRDQVRSFISPYQAGEFVKQLIQKNDKVLVKGSQNRVFTEEAAAILLANPKDKSKLVRQSDYWQKIKHRQFPR